MKKLLLTNDDGYTSPGLRALWKELDAEFETLVVAPARQKSWIGKALSNPGALTIEEKRVDEKNVFVVNDGTPADCVNLALFHLCTRPPDVVISGINLGGNVTASLALASGTIGAALEAALHNVRGLAVNLALDETSERALHDEWNDEHVKLFEPAARATKIFLREILPTLPSRAKLVNLVVPQHFQNEPRFRKTFPLAYEYGSVFEKRGNAYFNRGVGFIASQANVLEGSDVWAVRQNEIAYTCYTGKLESVSI